MHLSLKRLVDRFPRRLALASVLVCALFVCAVPATSAAAVITRSGPPTAQERAFWSFQPVRDPVAPSVKRTEWPRSQLDQFILGGLEARGLSPVKPAGRPELLRRATFDLTGLPPTPEEAAAFIADNSPDAFAKVVERLLASPAYGERWGRHWLDVVRYADTAGEIADFPVREAWKYRNWVINALNNDEPYDQFVRDQVAGDILAPATPPERYAKAVTATGYLAISRRFGFDSENYMHLMYQDTIDNMGQTMLGLSLGCARCHDHKFDPVTTADYYALYGIFASTNFAFPGCEKHNRPSDFVPVLPPIEAAARKKEVDGQIAALDAQIQKMDSEKLEVASDLQSVIGIDGGFESQPIEGPAAVVPWRFIDSARARATAQSPFTNLYPSGSRGIHFPSGGDNNAIVQTLAPVRTAAKTKLLYFNVDFRNISPAVAGAGGGSYRFYLGHGPGASAAVEAYASSDTFFIRNGDARESVRPLVSGVWQNLQIVLDLEHKTFAGAVGTPGDLTPFAGKNFSAKWDGTIDTFFVDCYGHIGGNKPEHEVDNVGIQETPIATLSQSPSVPTSAPSTMPPDQVTRRADELRSRAVLIDKARAEAEAKKNVIKNAEPYEVVYGVTEGTPTNAHIQKRGEPTKLGDEVPRRFLEVLGGDPLPASEKGSGRRELADWLTRQGNPLTARVMVNRIWQFHFGAGIVQTENDFGSRGKRPTHPELLDWLASRFVENKWSIKQMHRLLMLSQTYQLSCDYDERAAQVDPEDNLLWRFRRRRLDAEEVRDSMLQLAGTLDRSPGGAHPFPAVQTWGFSQHNPFYGVYETNRRSVYLMTQRMQRHPFLELFDGPDCNIGTARRDMTIVPTQALYMMNAPFMQEQSRQFAKRLIAARPDAAQRVALAIRTALGRDAAGSEIETALELHRKLSPSLV